tara:strand:- start:130 stop:546 length:417 start_codon:yes stop_codon:yes gene_type:complete
MQILIKLSLFLIVICFICSCKEDSFDGQEYSLEVFDGQWTVSEASSLLGSRNYIVEISLIKKYSSRINIFDFYKLGTQDSVFAVVTPALANTISIPDQTLKDNFIRGTGTIINDNFINLTYYVDDGNEIDTVVAKYTR